jgi:hypothetical protein
MTNKALQYFLDLKANGATDAEAKAQTEALTSVLEGVATKEDLKIVREDLLATKTELIAKLATKEELTNLGIRTDSKFDLVRKDILNLEDRIDINHRWIMAFLIANFVAFATLIITNAMRV